MAMILIGLRWDKMISSNVERHKSLMNGLKIPENSKVPGVCGTRGSEMAKSWK